MAIRTQTAGYYNTGKDIVLTIVYSQGAATVNSGATGIGLTPSALPVTSVQVENIMEYEYKEVTTDITKVRMDNRTLVADLPKLWEGTITFERGANAVDASFDAVERLWKDQAGDFLLGTLTLTVSSTVENTTITFLDATFRLEDAGTWKGDDTVRSRIAFRAGRRQVA